jgi:hypothetical protein
LGCDGSRPSTYDFNDLFDASRTIEQLNGSTLDVIEIKERIGDRIVKYPSMIACVGYPGQVFPQSRLKRIRDAWGSFSFFAHGCPLR